MIGQTYRERRPAPALAEVLSSVWIHRVPPDAGPYRQRNVPSGSVELLCRVGLVPRIVGPLTSPTLELLPPGSTVVGVRFRPGAAGSALGVPASELADHTLDAGELWGRSAVAAGDRIAEAASSASSASSASDGEATAILQALVAARLAAATDPDPLVAEAVRRLMPWRAGDIGSLGPSLGVSERQFRRRCVAALGVAPKALHRMLRFQRFLARAQFALARGRSPADDGLALLAADAGYADQAHLTRECVRLTGVTPATFLRETEQHCRYRHDHEVSFTPLLP